MIQEFSDKGSESSQVIDLTQDYKPSSFQFVDLTQDHKDDKCTLKCRHCMKEFNQCHEILFGRFCVEKMKSDFDTIFQYATRNDVQCSFQETYFVNLQYYLFQREGILVHQGSLKIPDCMKKGSLMRTMSWFRYKLNSHDIKTKGIYDGRK